MNQVETHCFADDGRFPNSRLPVLLYRAALAANASTMKQVFTANGWSNAWQNGIFTYHHFHSTAHEVLSIAAGEVRVLFGGPSGQILTIKAGDVVVIPAGVAHRNMGQTETLLVVGAYPGGSDYDTRRGEPSEHDEVRRNIAGLPLPTTDPISGSDGQLRQVWSKG